MKITISDILTIVFAVITIFGSLITYYLNIKNKITKTAVGLINDVEASEEEVANKKQTVIDQLYKLVPPAFKFVLTKKRLDVLVQLLFDKIEAYAKQQKEKSA